MDQASYVSASDGQKSHLAGLEVSFHHPFIKHLYHKQWRLKIKIKQARRYEKSFAEGIRVNEGKSQG